MCLPFFRRKSKNSNTTNVQTIKPNSTIETIENDLLFDEGVYYIDQSILVTKSNIHITGKGEGKTTLVFKNDATLIIGSNETNPNNIVIENLSLRRESKSSAPTIKIVNSHNIELRHLRFDENHFIPIQLEGGRQQFNYRLTNIEINSGKFGILIGSEQFIQDIYISDLLIANTDIGLYLVNVSGLYLSRADIINCKEHGLLTYPNKNQKVVDCFFTELICDTCQKNGIALYSGGGIVADINFVNSWASSNESNGVHLSNCNGILFNGCRFINNTLDGILVENSKNISIIGSQIFFNSKRNFFTKHGVEVTNSQNILIASNIIGKGGQFPYESQLYGILANNSNNVVLKDNILSGNKYSTNMDLSKRI